MVIHTGKDFSNFMKTKSMLINHVLEVDSVKRSPGWTGGEQKAKVARGFFALFSRVKRKSFLHYYPPKSLYTSPVLWAKREREHAPMELYLWNTSNGEGGLFNCGTTCAGEGGLWSDSGACMVICFSNSMGDGDLLRSCRGDGVFLGVLRLGDGGLGSKRVGKPVILVQRQIRAH